MEMYLQFGEYTYLEREMSKRSKPHEVVEYMKDIIRLLVEPICQTKNYDEFMKLDSSAVKRDPKLLKEVIDKLDPLYKHTMAYIVCFIKLVIKTQEN